MYFQYIVNKGNFFCLLLVKEAKNKFKYVLLIWCSIKKSRKGSVKRHYVSEQGGGSLLSKNYCILLSGTSFTVLKLNLLFFILFSLNLYINKKPLLFESFPLVSL